MLSGKFYQIKQFAVLQNQDAGIDIMSNLQFRPDHEIFQGHFPGNPIVPGVCMVQIIIEMVTRALNLSVRLTRCENLKFLRFINPDLSENVEARIHISSGADRHIAVSATFHTGIDLCLRFKGKFLPEP